MQKPQRIDFEIQYEGKSHSATYCVEGNIIAMESNWGTKFARPGANPLRIAKALFREILNEAKRMHIIVPLPPAVWKHSGKELPLHGNS